MITRILKSTTLALTLSLTLALPTAAIAGGCVSNVDNTVIYVENGSTYSTQRVVSFVADITRNDLYNSRGTRLTNAGAVLQQYVANRVKAGQYVTDDRFFKTLERRTLLSTSRLYAYCSDQAYQEQILSNIVNAQVQAAALWVVGFRHPDGSVAFLLSPSG